jgi:hypothetical protein
MGKKEKVNGQGKRKTSSKVDLGRAPNRGRDEASHTTEQYRDCRLCTLRKQQCRCVTPADDESVRGRLADLITAYDKNITINPHMFASHIPELKKLEKLYKQL